MAAKHRASLGVISSPDGPTEVVVCGGQREIIVPAPVRELWRQRRLILTASCVAAGLIAVLRLMRLRRLRREDQT